MVGSCCARLHDFPSFVCLSFVCCLILHRVFTSSKSLRALRLPATRMTVAALSMLALALYWERASKLFGRHSLMLSFPPLAMLQHC